MRTTEPATNPVPLTVRVKLPARARAGFGEMVEIEGTGLFTARARAEEAPPAGAALKTVTDSEPATAMSDAGIEALNWLELTKVVARFAPAILTTEPGTKFAPLTVNVNAGPPAVTLTGDMAASDGTGLLTVKARAALVPPLGVVTVMDSVPAKARSALVRVVESCVALMYVVLLVAPLTWMDEFGIKLLPLAVSVTGVLPAIAAVGERPIRVGVPAATVRLSAFDVQFPSEALVTVMGRLPTWLKSASVSCTVS